MCAPSIRYNLLLEFHFLKQTCNYFFFFLPLDKMTCTFLGSKTVRTDKLNLPSSVMTTPPQRGFSLSSSCANRFYPVQLFQSNKASEDFNLHHPSSERVSKLKKDAGNVCIAFLYTKNKGGSRYLISGWLLLPVSPKSHIKLVGELLIVYGSSFQFPH